MTKISLPLIFAAAVWAQSDQPAVSYIRISPILSALETNHDGVISADEIAAASACLRQLDKNGDGKDCRGRGGFQAIDA